MSRTYYREQKTICGKDYESADYMEVDIFPVSEKEHKQSLRQKRKKATELAQQTYNDKRSKRYHVQLVNTNFKRGDFSLTCTYNDDHLPAAEDQKRADQDWSNYIKRVYRYCAKHGIRKPKWVMATSMLQSRKMEHISGGIITMLSSRRLMGLQGKCWKTFGETVKGSRWGCADVTGWK